MLLLIHYFQNVRFFSFEKKSTYGEQYEDLTYKYRKLNYWHVPFVLFHVFGSSRDYFVCKYILHYIYKRRKTDILVISIQNFQNRPGVGEGGVGTAEEFLGLRDYFDGPSNISLVFEVREENKIFIKKIAC